MNDKGEALLLQEIAALRLAPSLAMTARGEIAAVGLKSSFAMTKRYEKNEIAASLSLLAMTGMILAFLATTCFLVIASLPSGKRGDLL